LINVRINPDIFERIQGYDFPSFRRKPESSHFKAFWTPAFAGVTVYLTFYEIINIAGFKRRKEK
jgi:hypothetical protein